MSIRQLSLTDFRNLESQTLDFHPALNIIYGDNGSGKTSLLEAIHVICRSDSFRQRQLKKCIRHGKKQFLIFSRFTDHKAGISRSDQKLEIRVNGENIKRRSNLVKLAPVKIFNSETFDLISGAPEHRRQLLDWCLFHVEQFYSKRWLEFRHALKQRNRILKDRRNLHLLDYWDQALIGPSLELSSLRSQYCGQIAGSIKEDFGELFTSADISLQYQAGWETGEDLLTALQRSREKDVRSGFTGQGIHRDNIEIQSSGRAAADVLSRGQIKSLTLVLLLASLKLVSSGRRQPVILLVDDLRAEIDRKTEEIILETLIKMNLQVFITNIEKNLPNSLCGKDFKMFHVEHGTIKPHKVS